MSEKTSVEEVEMGAVGIWYSHHTTVIFNRSNKKLLDLANRIVVRLSYHTGAFAHLLISD
jgi:hypothetical protein